MVNPEGYIYLHPGITAELSASSVVSQLDTARVISLRQANSHSRHSSHTSKAVGLFCRSSLLTRERPNTDASFSVSVSTEPLPPSVANVLCTDGISELLTTYPNRRFVDTLLSITTHGSQVGFEGTVSGHIQRPNHSSAFAHPEIITESIQSELRKGRIKQITSFPQNFFCSPIGLIPKQENGVQIGWRVIFDLSCPEGTSVNDGIPKGYGTIVYETLNDAVRLVAQAGRGAMMMKRDLKTAFRHVPINPCDYWLLLFEWEGKFYVDMFLPFGLRTAPRIFNLFAEALHWVFETLYEWNVTHYLDDFLFVFPPGTDIVTTSIDFDQVLTKFGLSKAIDKDSDGSVVVHLGFEFDSNKMQVRLPQNKKQRALDAVNLLLSSSRVHLSTLDSTLGFLSHCCQVVPLGRPFLRNLFSLLCRRDSRRHLHQIRLTREAREDLRWWHRFLISWSSISMIQLSRVCFDVATDASGKKGIGGVYNRQVFSERIPSRHKSKEIDWKEMFAILHAFLIWHETWCGGNVRLACDNSGVVDAINKHSIKGPAIVPLQRIFLIAAVFDIQILPFWIPTEENIVADAASRFDYKKLTNLGLQVSRNLPRPKDLRQKLCSFFTTPSRQALGGITTKFSETMSPSADNTDTVHIPRPLKRSHTGQLRFSPPSNLQQQNHTSALSVPSTSNQVSQPLPSSIPALISSLKGGNEFMEKVPRRYDIPSRPIFSSAWSMDSEMTRKGSMSKLRSVWGLPPSYDLENLRGILGQQNPTTSSSLAITSSSIPLQ